MEEHTELENVLLKAINDLCKKLSDAEDDVERYRKLYSRQILINKRLFKRCEARK